METDSYHRVIIGENGVSADYRVSCKKIPLTYYSKWCLQIFSAVLYLVIFIFAGNDDLYKSLDEFEFQARLTDWFASDLVFKPLVAFQIERPGMKIC